MKIAVINGPNLNMLGVREPNIYGSQTLSDLENMITSKFDDEFIFYQSNIEGEIINFLHQMYLDKIEGIVINPAAYSHYSVAILDALLMFDIDIVEVHISNPLEREDFRHNLLTAKASSKIISGEGLNGYLKAIEYIKKRQD